MTESCPKCGRPMNGRSCIACRLTAYMDSIRPTEKIKTKTESISPDIVPTKIETIIKILDEAEHKSSEDKYIMGSVEIQNDEDMEVSISVEACLDDTTLFIRKETIGPGKTVHISVESDITALSIEHDSRKNVVVSIYGEKGNRIAVESKGIVFRPVFDFNLNDRRDLVARWVTPNAKAIRDLLKTDGPVAKAMESMCGTYQVSGYQGNTPEQVMKNIILQIASTYNALKSIGFSYCSDTFSYGNSNVFKYQRVKTPRKTLEDHSGNCIELSCLFASIFEALGLHPVIVFPPGHAIVGVQVVSDIIGDMPKFKVDNMIRFENVEVSGGHVENTDVLFLESTMIVSEDSTPEAAIAAAMTTVRDNLEAILEQNDFSLIFFKRVQGIKPLIEG